MILPVSVRPFCRRIAQVVLLYSRLLTYWLLRPVMPLSEMPHTEFVTMLSATVMKSPVVDDEPLSPEPTTMPPSRALSIVLFTIWMSRAPCQGTTPLPTPLYPTLFAPLAAAIC